MFFIYVSLKLSLLMILADIKGQVFFLIYKIMCLLKDVCP